MSKLILIPVILLVSCKPSHTRIGFLQVNPNGRSIVCVDTDGEVLIVVPFSTPMQDMPTIPPGEYSVCFISTEDAKQIKEGLKTVSVYVRVTTYNYAHVENKEE